MVGHDEVTVRLAAYFALLFLSGLPRQPPSFSLTWLPKARPRRIWSLRLARLLRAPAVPRRSPERLRASTLEASDLSPIELAAIAEVNLELACAHDELAEDATQSAETRRRSRRIAIALYERADLFLSEARRLSAEPMTPCAQLGETPYTGPERREQVRRRAARRADQPVAADVQEGAERRMLPDRRRRERRRGLLGLP